MAVDVIVPEVGEVGMDVTFVRWLKGEGDSVEEGDPLFEVDTAKSVMEVQAFSTGRLTHLQVGPGDLVQPHQVVASLVQGSEVADAVPSVDQVKAMRAEPAGPMSGPAGATERGPIERGQRQPGASPRARRLARRRGVDLAMVVGTGPDGLITEHDVEEAADAAAGSPRTPSMPVSQSDARSHSKTDTDRAARIRQEVAEMTATSWRTIPHFYLRLEADVTAGLKSSRPTALICAAAVKALTRHPECNLEWQGERTVPRERLDLGLLVDTPNGLLLPVIRDADHLSLADLTIAIDEAAARAREGALKTGDFGPRSLTVSNLGMFAVDSFDGVIAAPDALLLAVGRIRTVPWWDGEVFRPRQVASLTLSVDHRAIDGAAAGRYLTTLEVILRDPAELA